MLLGHKRFGGEIDIILSYEERVSGASPDWSTNLWMK